MKTAYVLLVEDFEEIEAVTPVDFMRRAGIQVYTVGITGNVVKGAHGIPVKADLPADGFVLPQEADMVILPGGSGTLNLQKSPVVKEILASAQKRGIFIAAICAAPTVLHNQGLLNGKTVTAFPAVQKELAASNVTGNAVEVDGNIITARAAGVALKFAHTLTTLLVGEETADKVLQNIYP